MNSPLDTLHRSEEHKSSNGLVILSHKIQVFLICILECLDLRQVLLLIELNLIQLLLVLRLLKLDVQFLNLLADLFDANDVLQELVVTHCELDVDYFCSARIWRRFKLGDLVRLLAHNGL